jgi:hypothetical protein
MAADFVTLTADTFAPHQGTSFRVHGGHHVLSLNEVDRFGNPPGQADRAFEPFVLIFSGPAGDVLAEGIHTITGEDGTAYDLYLIPIQTHAPARQDYQAVFN